MPFFVQSDIDRNVVDFSVENRGYTILRQFKEPHVSGDVTLPLIIMLRSWASPKEIVLTRGLEAIGNIDLVAFSSFHVSDYGGRFPIGIAETSLGKRPCRVNTMVL